MAGRPFARASRLSGALEHGSLVVPNPNLFDGEVFLRALGDATWSGVPVSAGYLNAGRGYGLADMMATSSGQEPRAGGRLAYHVLDIMEALRKSLEMAKKKPPVSERPAERTRARRSKSS